MIQTYYKYISTSHPVTDYYSCSYPWSKYKSRSADLILISSNQKGMYIRNKSYLWYPAGRNTGGILCNVT